MHTPAARLFRCCRYAFLGGVMMTLSLAANRASAAGAESHPLVPTIVGDWWTVANSPDLGDLTNEKQQPVDFAIWQAADGTWQIWSCIRNTKEPGKKRLLYRWEGARLTDTDWKPMGIAMQADEKYGETRGGLQAPFVIRDGDEYVMFYGDWNNICSATSKDGKHFTRRLNGKGVPALFGNDELTHTRDPMVLKIGDLWHCYYTAYPNRLGSDYCRTSRDLLTWSEPTKVAFGGAAGPGGYMAECPYVVEVEPGHFYLFRTQHYPGKPMSRVYYSTDPLKFGIDEDDKYLVCEMPVAAMEIVRHEGQYYMAALLPSLKGIRLARLEWRPKQ